MNSKGACPDDVGGLQGTPQSIQKEPRPNAAPLPFAMHGKPRQNKEGDWVPWHALDDPRWRIVMPRFARNNRIESDNRFAAQSDIGLG